MARVIRELKPYKGYSITRYNGKRYVSTDPHTKEQFGADSLEEIKRQINEKIDTRNLRKELGKLIPLKIGGKYERAVDYWGMQYR